MTTTRHGVLAAIFTMGCAATPAPLPPVAAAPRARVEPLPAGTYFRDGFYEDAACEGCAEPRHAVIAGVFTDDIEATASVQRSPSFGAGYPWVVDAYELGLEDEDARGMVVVLGLFETLEHANLASGGTHAVATLATREVALERHEDQRMREDEAPTRDIVQIDGPPGSSAPAYTRGDLDEVFGRAQGAEFDSYDHYLEVMDGHVAGLEPACTLAAGSVHSRAPDDDRWRFHPLFVQARCEDGRDAWVRLTSTRVDTVVRGHEGGDARLIQVIIVECDSATFAEWRLGEQGREPLGDAPPTRLAERGDCGVGQ